MRQKNRPQRRQAAHRSLPLLRADMVFIAIIAVTVSAGIPFSRASGVFAALAKFNARTRVTLKDGMWHINGKLTNSGSAAEGLLMNVRMVNATFEDRNAETRPKGFDPDKNTAQFVRQIPAYAKSGVNAFTLCLQGGSCGYEGAKNSAYEADGSLRPTYMARVAKVIEACDQSGLAVILGCFYQRQDQVLKDTAAVKQAVVLTAQWIQSRGYKNVILEVVNEHGHRGFDHAILKDPSGTAGLIRLAKKSAPGLLVTASGLGNGRMKFPVGTASDFILIHFNNTMTKHISARVFSLTKYVKAIVCNEDNKTGEEGARACQAAVDSLCSWGYMNVKRNQHYPFEFNGPDDDAAVYAKLRQVTGGN